MRTALRVIASIFMLMMGVVALPAAASEGSFAAEGLQPAVVLPGADGGAVMPAAFKSGLRHMSMEELVAIVAGAAVIGTAADWAFQGGALTILGVVVGAALGSEWYERGMWPF
jgi:hypothetical protein